MKLDEIINMIVTIIMVAPVVIEAVKYLGAATHNKKIVNLADRAMIIVSSLDALDIANSAKKQEALNKLLGYAGETSIKLTTQQAEDYIESAVQKLRRLQETTKVEVNNNASKTKK